MIKKVTNILLFLWFWIHLIYAGHTDQTEEDFSSLGYGRRNLKGGETHHRYYPAGKEPDTISQTSFRSINEVDYGRVQDTQENERLLFQVNEIWIQK